MTNLKAILAKRYGQFVPIQWCYNKFVASDWCATQNGLRVSVIHPLQKDVPKSLQLHQEYKEFMWNNFYPAAPIPRALQMVSHRAQLEDLVEKEMALYLYSGLSLEFRSTPEQELQGLLLCCQWSRNHQYFPLHAKALDWHNAAAELATEMMPHLPQKYWRDLQFQHLYDACQSAMVKYGTNHVLWFGMFVLNQQVRGQKLGFLANPVLIRDSHKEDCLFGTQSNFPGFDRQVSTIFPGSVVWDELQYADEKLELARQPAFESIRQCQGIKFYFQHIHNP